MRTRLVAILLAGAVLAAPVAKAGRIVVNHDEWTFTATGVAQAGAANVSTFIANIASFMNIDGGACSFLVYSTNGGLTSAAFTSGMSAAGCTRTLYTGPFNAGLGALANYDGVFLGNPPTSYNPATLAAYINSGGSAYVMAGTGGPGGAAGEAALWNAFLNGFGLNLGSPYNGVSGVDPVQVSHQLETGVSGLYYNNGNTVSLFGSNPYAQIIEFSDNGPLNNQGVLGVFDDVAKAPAPATLLSLGLGLLAMGSVRRRGRFDRR